MRFFTAILSALALAVMTTTATPIDSNKDGAITLTVPDILSPKAGDIWYVANTTALVSWDPTAIPHEAGINKTFIGTLLLGHDDGDTSFASDSLDVSKSRRPAVVYPSGGRKTHFVCNPLTQKIRSRKALN